MRYRFKLCNKFNVFFWKFVFCWVLNAIACDVRTDIEQITLEKSYYIIEGRRFSMLSPQENRPYIELVIYNLAFRLKRSRVQR
ncbi:hypothetical protein FHU10_0661 [Serratia fonticola]|uniref:Uncharacterized protein n=1 Tax=Serratia fonticola TaxID=47917 RepID=A0A559T0X2_SERFO|nr:hypothetical protein FHU09_1787 [Serratia fonticola]TQI98709.1 hypothetical protein FHU11_4261 [Serratia fonticola]TVZ68235.1 hypothetical protein FHU10_0661 [Serratia fonticola]